MGKCLSSSDNIFNNHNPIFVKTQKHNVPMKRMGNTDDIAAAVRF